MRYLLSFVGGLVGGWALSAGAARVLESRYRDEFHFEQPHRYH